MLFIAGILFSCKQTKTDSVNNVKSPVDSLIANWQNVWNNNDSSGICNMFAADAILIETGLLTTNVKDMSEKWVGPSYRLVKNMKTEKLQDWSTTNRAGYTGKYNLDLVAKDSLIAHLQGVFSVDWMKTNEGDWKITSANINDFDYNK